MQTYNKTCLLQKICMIKPAITARLFLNTFIMKQTLQAVALSTLMAATSQANTNTQQEKIICETIEICQKLTHSIQAQINELEQSNNPDFDKLDLLQNKLIALENQKQTIQKETIAEEFAETAEVQKTDQRLEALETALSLENK